ncbi:MAG: DUF1684 domain-containing protein [Vicinamibacterales bacterium]
MTARRLPALVLTLAVLTAACGSGAPAEDAAAPAPAPAPASTGPERSNGPLSPEALDAQVQAWRDKHETEYRREWVSIAGLHFLEPGAQTFGRAVANDIVVSANVPDSLGRLVLSPEGSVTYEPAPGVAATIKGEPVTGPATLRDDSQKETDEFVVGSVRMVIHRSGDRLSLRVRDPEGQLARGFLGFTWFDIDPAYRVTGRFIPDETPTEHAVLNTVGDLDHFTSDGVIEFTLKGETLRLRPFNRGERFYIVFRDASAGDETYETARFLYADRLPDGTTTLDFNEAYNPPCSFNPFTTCPIPLKENVLPVKILAGEKKYPVHPTLPTGE